MTQYRRTDAFPLPTVEAIEAALDTLLTAIVEHGAKRCAAPSPPGQNQFIVPALTDLLDTEFLPGEDFIKDPVGEAMRYGLRKLGKCLFALTGSLDIMRDVCDRVADCRKPYALRANLIDKWWDGIGDEHARWTA